MISHKKGSVELKIVIIAIFFMFILNLFVAQITPDYSDFEQQEVIDEITDELDAVSGFITTALLNVGITLFSIIGVDFIGAIEILPTWFITFISIYNTIVVIALIFYLVDRIWVG